MMKLIHSADWHLASPMECRLPAEKAEVRRRELLARFADMVTYAKEHAIDAVLLCGDLSDDGILPFEVQDYLLSLIEGASPMRFFLIAGNHDRIGPDTVGGCFTKGRRRMPDNLTVFGEMWGEAALSEDVVIHGRSLSGHAVKPEIPDFSVGQYHIVMLHGAITESSARMGGDGEILPLGALRGKNIDYLALGHEHAFRHKRLDARGTWCYPGCPEGRGFDECGMRGFVVLELCGTHCSGASFVPFSRRQLHDLKLDITDITDGIYAAEQAIGSLVKDLSRDDLVRVTVCGTDPTETGLDLRYLENRLRAQFFYAEMRDARVAKADGVSDVPSFSLRGAFLRAAADLDITEEERAAVIRCGLAALDGRADDTLPREEAMHDAADFAVG